MLSALTPTLPPKAQPTRLVGRYVMYDEIASGGMASVHFGRLHGAVGFSRTVAIKSLHPYFAHDAEFISMFLDEVRLVSRIKHPNVAAPLDVVLNEDSAELFLIMEYIHGGTLSHLIKSAAAANIAVPPAISACIVNGVLRGLHAAHEAADEFGAPLNIVHRDVSPHNIMVGVDGVPRVLDFGVAKAVSRSQSTHQGQLKGKVAYMAPEQMGAGPVDRRADIFAAGIVFWEALTLRRLFSADDSAGIIAKVQTAPIDRPSASNPNVSLALDQVLLKALNRDPNLRFQTAQDFADAIEEAIPLPSARKVGEWVVYLGGEDLAKCSAKLSKIESDPVAEDSHAPALERPRAQGDDNQPRPALKRPGTYSEINTVGTQVLAERRKIRNGNAEDPGQNSAFLLMAEVLSWSRRHWGRTAAAAIVVVAMVAGAVSWVRISNTTQMRAIVDSSPVDKSAIVVSALPAQTDARQPSPATAAAWVESKPRPSAISRSASPIRANAQSSTMHRHAKNDCNPPFFLDGQGIRRVKPQCL
jgi:eukaryotic-like serine/threonine-protein kinase